jgi:hypothetical protein
MSQIYANASQLLAYLGIPPAMETARLQPIVYIQNNTSVALEMAHLENTLMNFLAIS